MKSKQPDAGVLVEQMEALLGTSDDKPELNQVLRAVDRLIRLRDLANSDKSTIEPFIDRISRAKSRLLGLLSPQLEQLIHESFGVKTEIEALNDRYSQLTAAIKEVFRAQGEQKIRKQIPAFNGIFIAYERHTTSLPKPDSQDRTTLEALLRQTPAHWMDASVLQAGRLRSLCDRLASKDPAMADSLRKYLKTNRDFTLLLRSPQFKNSEPAGE